jgi:N-acetyl-anhydromuramyl-L-alanine amidase AmpD
LIPRTSTTEIVVHGAWTTVQSDPDVGDIREWHEARGFADIGYHYVIRRDGTVEEGRSVELQGAHVAHHNHYTIGICLNGGRPYESSSLVVERPYGSDKWDFNYTLAQIMSLTRLVEDLLVDYPTIQCIRGHRDYPGVTKDCPGFDVGALLGPNLAMFQ